MRYDAPFLVKRYAPLIGRPQCPRRVTVAFQAYALEEAIRWAVSERQRRLDVWSTRAATFWIERRGQSARRRPRS